MSIKITCPYCGSDNVRIWSCYGTFAARPQDNIGYSLYCKDCGGYFDLQVKKYTRHVELPKEQQKKLEELENLEESKSFDDIIHESDEEMTKAVNRLCDFILKESGCK